MRNHFLRASGVPSSSSGSFSRGFYGGSSTSKLYSVTETSDYSGTGQYLGVSHSSDPTITEDITWIMESDNFQSFFSSYYRAHKVQEVILADELTAASVPSGAKFNKLSQYIWGSVATTGKIPRGVRWSMYHRDSSDTSAPYDVKDGGTATVLYQDNATTEFPPLVGISGSSNMSIANGSMGELIEVSAGGGNDTSITPASFFQWDGSSDIIVEIATKQTASGYQSNSGCAFTKHRDFLGGGSYRNDSDTSAYDNDADSNSSALHPYAIKTSGSADYSNWTNFSNWAVNTNNYSYSNTVLIQSLKLDYTT
tara:strand:- start:356 stop:1285 length:930 start_codon:yes stop_codon:yes gene_type:complete